MIITSYEIVRGDIEFLGSIKWNYLFLDEGHVIKNTKTKTAMAIRQLVASHRVILTGTPIQNGVNELWALFDFLMPGYLGSEKQFTAKYSKPIVNSRDAKSTSKEQEAGALAIEALHRQTLPFILRRVKEDVLDDLPPKITQDYYCELSPVQTELYEDFAKSQAKDNSSPTHVFQALQYLKKVCNHPRLVLTKEHPSYRGLVSSHLGGDIENLNSIEHAAKLTALKQLLTDLGMAGVDGEPGDSGPIVSQHRALIFCQLKTMLDILESDLLKVILTISILDRKLYKYNVYLSGPLASCDLPPAGRVCAPSYAPLHRVQVQRRPQHRPPSAEHQRGRARPQPHWGRHRHLRRARLEPYEGLTGERIVVIMTLS